MAVSSARPHRAYLDLIASVARERAEANSRYAPLIDIAASIRASASPKPAATSATWSGSRQGAPPEEPTPIAAQGDEADDRRIIDELVGRTPLEILPQMLQALAPSLAGLVETVLMAIAAVEETGLPQSDPGRREAWSIAFALLLARRERAIDVKIFLRDISLAMAVSSARPHRAYLDLIASVARERAESKSRFAPLVDIVASIRASASPRPAAASAAHSAAPSGRTPIAAPGDVAADRAGSAARQPDDDSGAMPAAGSHAFFRPAFELDLDVVVEALSNWRTRMGLSELPSNPILNAGLRQILERSLTRAVHERPIAGAPSDEIFARPSSDHSQGLRDLLDHLSGGTVLDASDELAASQAALASVSRESPYRERVLAALRAHPSAVARLASLSIPDPDGSKSEKERPGAPRFESSSGIGNPPISSDPFAGILELDNRLWWSTENGEARVASALRVALAREPGRLVSALRNVDRSRASRSLVRYAPIERLRELVGHLAPGLATPISDFLFLAGDRKDRSAKVLLDASWRIGMAILLGSHEAAIDFARFVAETNLQIDRKSGLSTEDAIVDVPGEPAAAGSATREEAPYEINSALHSVWTDRNSSDDAIDNFELFGQPIVFDRRRSDPLLFFRYLVRYGTASRRGAWGSRRWRPKSRMRSRARPTPLIASSSPQRAIHGLAAIWPRFFRPRCCSGSAGFCSSAVTIWRSLSRAN